MDVPFIFVNGQGGTPDITIEQNESGIDILRFTTVEEDPILDGLRYEDEVRYIDDTYRVKACEIRNGEVNVECRLDLYLLRTTWVDLLLETDFTDVKSLVTRVIEESGWQCQFTGSWSGELDDMELDERYRGSALEVLHNIHENFGVCFKFQPQQKTVVVFDPYGLDINIAPILLHEDVNLRDVDCKGDTLEIATRLYPYGKDKNGNELDIASINDGKAYVECFDYTSVVYPKAWEHDATTAKGLLAAAKREVRKMCLPQESYQFDVIDLYRINPDVWKNYRFEIGTIAYYYDRVSKMQKRMQVTKIIEHGSEPEKTTIEIAYRPITGGMG